MLSRFSRVQLSATPWTVARQAPLSMGFSRQEYWSGLPFPSPVIKYEVSEVRLLSRVQLFATPRTIQSMEFSRPEYWSGWPFPSPGRLPNPGIKPRSPALQADSLPAEPQGKSKKTGVGSLSLLQGIFPTQGLNPGLPHCRQILDQLSHKGSPRFNLWLEK